jgi:hypothetical protein
MIIGFDKIVHVIKALSKIKAKQKAALTLTYSVSFGFVKQNFFPGYENNWSGFEMLRNILCKYDSRPHLVLDVGCIKLV